METLRMSVEERRRLVVLSRVKSAELCLVRGAELLGICYRQAKRLWARYQSQGDAGVVHGLRGRASNRQAAAGLQDRVLELYREKYSDYGPTLAAECLAADDGVVVPVGTLRRWLSQAGVWQRQRKRKVHRRRRDRREQRGELVQMDGSLHDWFEGRRAWATLMVMIDDATGTVDARFFENESWDSAATMFRDYTQRRGLPAALYVDRHGIYRADRDPTPEEILAEKEPQTQFGRAMQELGVQLILARSPQAKGRVERMNGTLQDRLVKALRRAGISDLGSANRFLVETFLPEFNAKFSRAPAKQTDLHRALPAEDLLRVLSIQEERVVQNDWTVRWDNGILQLPRLAASLVQPKQRVLVCQQLDGRLRVFVGEQELSWSPHRDTTCSPAPKRAPRGRPTGSSQGHKPRANHPWRGTKPRLSPALPAPTAAVSGVGLACSAPVAALLPLRSPIPPRKPK
jgi:hypothetical protein